MSAIEEDGTRAPITIKPPPKRPTKKPTKIIGPVAPTTSPTRVYGPVQTTPNRPATATKPVQSPTPTYTNTIFQQRPKPVKIDTSISKPTNTVGDFIRGLKDAPSHDIPNVLAGADHDVDKNDALQRILSFREADQTSGQGEQLLGRREELQSFLQKIMPQNYDPEYGGVTMPEEYKHIGNDINKPLKPHWDAKAIAANLADFEPGSSFARFAMNDVIKKQLGNQSQWVRRQTVNRAMRLKDTLEDAADAAFDGDFDYLAEKLEKNPNLLEFHGYKDDFTTGPDDVVREWAETKSQYSDEWVKKAMRSRSDTERKHYEFVRKSYSISQSIAARAIKKYEKTYNRSVEFAENGTGKKAEAAKAAGPAIPEANNERQGLLDTIGRETPESKGSARFLGDREYAKQRLGVDKLPSVKEMLAAMVSDGRIDPDNEGEVAAWITRLQNPNHPDTRALYVSFARSANKDLDLKGDALDYINEPINSYIAKEKEKSRRDFEAKQKGAELGQKAAAGFVLDTLKEPWNAFDKEDTGERFAENLLEAADEKDTQIEKSVGAMFWTFDKLARSSYAVAGATDEWNKLDQDDPTKASAWWNPGKLGPFGFALAPINLLQGKNLQDSMDEVWSNPGNLVKPASAGYQQFFRGSDLPGIDEDTIPITFSQVIANNALWDPEDNLYDKSWYQHTAGFVLDVATDPLNFVGIGAINATMKVPVNAAKAVVKTGEISRNAVTPARFLRELNAPAKSPAAERAYRIQQTLARYGDEVEGDALITEAGAKPYSFTVEYGKDLAPVGKAGEAPTYTNQRYFADTKSSAAEINQELKELAVLQANYPSQVALKSHQQELQKIIDDLDLGADVLMPEIRVRTIMEQNSTNINVTGVPNLKLNNPGGRFWRDVLNPVEDAAAKWPGHKSRTRFAEFTDESGKTRLTERASAARRAISEEEEFYRLGQTAPDDVMDRWSKALDEAGDVDPKTGKPAMWQEYDIEHYLDEGAPGLISGDSGWTPLKAYAKGSGLEPEAFAKVTGWTNEEIIRSLHRGPKLLQKADPVYAKRITDATNNIKFAKEKLAKTTKPEVRAAAYKALQMAYRDMSQATLEGSFHYLDSMRSGSRKWLGRDVPEDLIKRERIDSAIAALDEIDTTDDAVRSWDDSGNVGYDGSYRDINMDEFNSVEDALNSVDSAEFPSRQAQIEALRAELESQKAVLSPKGYNPTEVVELTERQVIELDKILPIESPFRKGDGFDHEMIARHLTHNKTDIAKNNTGIFKVTYKKPALRGEGEVALARQAREMKFLDAIAKRIEEKADALFRVDKTNIVRDKKIKTPVPEPVQRLEDELSVFWTKGPDGREGPTVRKLGPKPTRAKLEAEHPVTFKHERGKSQAERNQKRNVEEVDIDRTPHLQSKPNKTVAWDASKGMSKTAAERRIEAVVKGQQRRWEKARRAAQETDAARYKELREELGNLKAGNKDFNLTAAETQTIYRTSFKEAMDDVLNFIDDSKTLMARGANARLSVQDTTKAMHKQAGELIRMEELKLKIAKAEAETVEEFAALEARRKGLIKKKIALYDRVKKAKMEANSVRITMQHRVGEEHVLQALSMPERVDAKVLQLHMFGMKKNLQFTSGMFKGAEIAEKFVPASVWAKYQNTFVRPSKQLRTAEGVEHYSRWESKTPVLVYSRLQKLTKSMANTTESERSGMLMAFRRGVPYGGPKQAEYFSTIQNLEEIMDVINGNHIAYMFRPLGKHTAEPLSLPELLRFLPEQYVFDMSMLNRIAAKNAGKRTQRPVGKSTTKPVRDDAQQEAWIDLRDGYNAQPSGYVFTGKQLDFMDDLGGDANKIAATETPADVSRYIDELKDNRYRTKITAPDPFSPAPAARSDFTFDDLMEAIESNGKATPKDLMDPFRVSWVYSLAAEQASQLRALTKSIGETFGVPRPENVHKAQVWNRLSTHHDWKAFKEIPNVYFPPEIVKEVETLLKFTQPGPEQAAITKMMDQAIGYWKQGMTIYNPAYYTRNGIGEMMVSWLDGVNHPKWYRYSHRVSKYVKNTDQDLADLVSKYDVLEGKIPVDVAKGNEVLFSLKGGLKVRIEDVLKEYVDQGLKSTFANTDIGRGVRGLANQSLESNPLRRGLAKTNNKVHEVGEGFEDYLRMAHFMHAMEKSGKGSLKEAASYAATRVRRSHFDYTDFSDFEKTVMLRAFPFYKWIRRGAPLMMQHLFMTPGKMIAAPKAMDAMSGLGLDPMNAFNEGPVLDTQDVYEDKNGYLPNYSGIAPAWIRDLFSYQMQPAEDDEYANFFRVSLPQYDGLQGILSLAEGDIMDSPVNTLMNPFVKAPLELGLNKSLDPDNNFPIVGGEYNENMGISDNEARGAYLARQANPWTSFLAKLSKNGKLPDGLNVSDVETGRDATRDVASFFTGMGLYQSKLTPEPESAPDVSSSAVGQYESIGEVPLLSGRAAPSISNEDTAVKRLMDAANSHLVPNAETGTTSGWIPNKYGDKKSGWIPNKYGNKKSGWIPNKYGNSGSGFGGFGGSGGFSAELMELLMRLTEEIDSGDVIDVNKIKWNRGER